MSYFSYILIGCISSKVKKSKVPFIKLQNLMYYCLFLIIINIFRPLDVVILFLAYSAASNDQSTKNTVLSIFKERIKNGFFRVEIMEQTFQTFTPVGYLRLLIKQ